MGMDKGHLPLDENNGIKNVPGLNYEGTERAGKTLTGPKEGESSAELGKSPLKK